MADQEFLASFGVQIDESGLNRLQKALKDNRTLADDLASSFDKARAAVKSFFADLSEVSMDGIASGTGSEDRTGMNLSFSLDFTKATKQLTVFFKEMSNSLHLSADASGVVKAGRNALSQLQSLYASTTLRVSASVSPSGSSSGSPSGASGASGASGSASSLLAGSSLSSSVSGSNSRTVQAPVSINVTANSANAEAVGRSVYNVAEQYLLRTLNSAMG